MVPGPSLKVYVGVTLLLHWQFPGWGTIEPFLGHTSWNNSRAMRRMDLCLQTLTRFEIHQREEGQAEQVEDWVMLRPGLSESSRSLEVRLDLNVSHASLTSIAEKCVVVFPQLIFYTGNSGPLTGVVNEHVKCLLEYCLRWRIVVVNIQFGC